MRQTPYGAPGQLELAIFDIEGETVYEAHQSKIGNSGLAVCSSANEEHIAGSFSNGEQKVLKKTLCHSSCSRCSDGTANGCETCPLDKYLRTDKSCQESCQEFEAYGPQSICKLCPAGQVVENHLCKIECSFEYYQVGEVCRKCDKSCLTCKETSFKCTSCPEGKSLINQQCALSCPIKSDYLDCLIKEDPKLIGRLDEIQEQKNNIVAITVSFLEKETETPFKALFNISKELLVVFKSEYKSIGSKIIYVQKNQNSSLEILVSPEEQLKGDNYVIESDFLFVKTNEMNLVRVENTPLYGSYYFGNTPDEQLGQ